MHAGIYKHTGNLLFTACELSALSDVKASGIRILGEVAPGVSGKALLYCQTRGSVTPSPLGGLYTYGTVATGTATAAAPVPLGARTARNGVSAGFTVPRRRKV
jgi:hypothetical protein